MTLLLKLVLAPLLVVGSSLAGRRWGDRVAGMLAALPIVAGPILLITALEHGPGFGAGAAAGSLLGLVSLAVFVVSFAYAGRRLDWLPALAVSWATTIAVDILLSRWPFDPYWTVTLVLVVAVVADRLVGRVDDEVTGPVGVALPWWDLPARAAATAALVLTVTGVSATVGPAVTGILAPFPIASSVIAAFVRAHQGPAATVRTLAGVTRGLPAFAAFSFVLAVLLVPLGVAGAFLAAVAGAMVVQLAGRVR
ncbi:hypothetical protein [Actinoplanes sp. NPDC049265]|uniref:hypothetical protein n=1 Tax=Actinoplanes sp. NPDC049265 TaxID=3363902 RepID=UPI003722D17E